MQENSKIKQNILQYIDYKGISKYEFYQKSGITRGILDQPNGISEENITKFLVYAKDINPTWLLTSKESMLLHDDFNSSIISEPLVEYGVKKNKIPLLPVSAAAGFSSFETQILHHEIEAYFEIPYLKGKPNFAIQVNGESMSPQYQNGSYIICEIISIESFKWEVPHVILVNHAPMIKRIYPSINPGALLCRSDNDRYKDFEVLKSDITGIAKILACVNIEDY